MKWPFVRRSKYENAIIYGINTAKEITEKTSYIHKLEDQIEIYRKLHDEYAQLNNDNLVEINRLNQELANELNDHRETKDHEQKLFEAHDKLNQQNMGLLFENEKLSKQISQLRFDKYHLKQKIKKLESKVVSLDADYEIMKKNADWFYGNYCRFKDMIEKSGYFPGK